MVDPGCELRTWADALYVGRACDEAECFWFEDPYRDPGVSAHGVSGACILPRSGG